MTRDDIYDHLAQVYLGKKNQPVKKDNKQFNAWLVINLTITFIIFASATYGLTAFLAQKGSVFENNIIYALHHGTIRMSYNFKDVFHPEEVFALSIPDMDATKYQKLQFSIRGQEEGTPGIVKVKFRNQLNEEDSFYIQGVGQKWQKVSIPLSEFQNITDWSNLDNISFILEQWNVQDQKGIILIEDISFSS